MTTVVPSRHRHLWVILAFTAACTACAPTALQQTEAPQSVATSSASAAATKIAPARQAAEEHPSQPSLPVPGKGDQELARCVASYEDGAYKNAALQCQAALDLGLAAKADQATAHKYLAFVVCVSGREKACRDEFRKAVEADPGFELGPAEIGHPVWGPVFRSVKAEARAKTKVQ
jgi:hypothetical protein